MLDHGIILSTTPVRCATLTFLYPFYTKGNWYNARSNAPQVVVRRTFIFPSNSNFSLVGLNNPPVHTKDKQLLSTFYLSKNIKREKTKRTIVLDNYFYEHLFSVTQALLWSSLQASVLNKEQIIIINRVNKKFREISVELCIITTSTLFESPRSLLQLCKPFVINRFCSPSDEELSRIMRCKKTFRSNLALGTA